MFLFDLLRRLLAGLGDDPEGDGRAELDPDG